MFFQVPDTEKTKNQKLILFVPLKSRKLQLTCTDARKDKELK